MYPPVPPAKKKKSCWSLKFGNGASKEVKLMVDPDPTDYRL